MKNNIKKLALEYKSTILYLIFGVVTTMVNFLIFWSSNKVLGSDYLSISVILAWLISVSFAYFTNKNWVFESNAHSLNATFKEILSFFSARLLSGFLDFILVMFFVKQFKFDENIVKIVTNVIVIIINYFTSKLIVFKKK